MRILFLSNFYPPYEHGGYEQLCREVADGLAEQGHEVAVVTSDYGADDRSAPDSGIFRVLHTEVDMRPYRGQLDFFFNRKQRLKETLSRFEEVVDAFKPEILFVWSMWNLPRELLIQAEGRPELKVVYYLADYWPTLPDAYTLHWQERPRRGYLALPKRLLAKIALAGHPGYNVPGQNLSGLLKFKYAFCVSAAVRLHLVEAGFPLQNAQVIYNGIDLGPFLRAGQRRDWQPALDELSLVYAGRLAENKGVHTAIEGVDRLIRQGRRVRLTLVGSGPAEYIARLQELSRQLGVSDRINFYGAVPREQMPELMARFDVLVFPSIWQEPLARIVQEAMAIGLVVVGTEVGGMKEILQDGVNGLTFPAGDADALAGCVAQLMDRPELHSSFAEAGRRMVVEKFDLQRMIAEVERRLQDIQRGQDENPLSFPVVPVSAE